MSRFHSDRHIPSWAGLCLGDNESAKKRKSDRIRNYQTSFSFRPYEAILKVDRKFSGSRRAIIHQRRCLINNPNGKKSELRIRVILDCYSVEEFVNDEEQVMTAIFYTDQKAAGISLYADGAANMDIVKYGLE